MCRLHWLQSSTTLASSKFGRYCDDHVLGEYLEVEGVEAVEHGAAVAVAVAEACLHRLQHQLVFPPLWTGITRAIEFSMILDQPVQF